LYTNYYSDNPEIIKEEDDEYDAVGDEWGEKAAAAIQGPSISSTDANLPESFIVELHATARENQIKNVIKSTVNNYESVATTPSIYDFQGRYLIY
jgi:hypothetical protein